MTSIPNRNKFSGLADEADYLYDKAGFWMYERDDYRRAERFVKRLKKILATWNIDSNLVPYAEAKALIADFDGDIRGEIRYTKQKIGLLLRLLCISPKIDAYDWSDVLDEMEILALLLEENAQRVEALKMVDECKAFARQHKLKFDEGKVRKQIWKVQVE